MANPPTSVVKNQGTQTHEAVYTCSQPSSRLVVCVDGISTDHTSLTIRQRIKTKATKTKCNSPRPFSSSSPLRPPLALSLLPVSCRLCFSCEFRHCVYEVTNDLTDILSPPPVQTLSESEAPFLRSSSLRPRSPSRTSPMLN